MAEPPRARAPSAAIEAMVLRAMLLMGALLGEWMESPLSPRPLEQALWSAEFPETGGRGDRGKVPGVPMMATIMLADAAQAIDNKLYVLGGGWSITGPDPTPSALAIALKVPWDEANRRHDLRVELVDSDGDPITMGSAGEGQSVVVESHFEVGGRRAATGYVDRPGARDQPGPRPASARRALRVAAEHRRAQRSPLARGLQHARRTSIRSIVDEDIETARRRSRRRRAWASR